MQYWQCSFGESLWHKINVLCDISFQAVVFLAYICDNLLYIFVMMQNWQRFLWRIFVTQYQCSLWLTKPKGCVFIYICDTLHFILVTMQYWQCSFGGIFVTQSCCSLWHIIPSQCVFWYIFVTPYIISLWWCKIGSVSFEESLWHNINALCDLQNPRDVFLVLIWDMNALYLCDKGKLQRSFLTLFVTSNFSSLWHKHFQAVILGYVCDTILFIFVTSESRSFFSF